MMSPIDLVLALITTFILTGIFFIYYIYIFSIVVINEIEELLPKYKSNEREFIQSINQRTIGTTLKYKTIRPLLRVKILIGMWDIISVLRNWPLLSVNVLVGRWDNIRVLSDRPLTGVFNNQSFLSVNVFIGACDDTRVLSNRFPLGSKSLLVTTCFIHRVGSPTFSLVMTDSFRCHNFVGHHSESSLVFSTKAPIVTD